MSIHKLDPNIVAERATLHLRRIDVLLNAPPRASRCGLHAAAVEEHDGDGDRLKGTTTSARTCLRVTLRSVERISLTGRW